MIKNEIKEHYVSFEVSKLLMGKGFNVPQKYCPNYYNYKGEFKGDIADFVKASLDEKDTKPFENVLAPTQAVAVEWLRVNFNCYLFAYPIEYLKNDVEFKQDLEDIEYCYKMYVDGVLLNYSLKEFTSPQEAIEEGIKYLLVNIVQK